MPIPAKAIYLATNLADLRKRGTVDLIKWKDKSCTKLMESANKLYTNAKTLSVEGEPDEELVYVYLYRAMELWQLVMKTPDYAADKKFVELMYGKDLKEIISMLETYTDKLQKRYAALENGSVSKNKESLKNQYKLATNAVPKKRKEGKNSTHEKSNGTKDTTISDQNCLDEYNLILNADISKPKSVPYGEKKFMGCEVLKEKVMYGSDDVLVIDIRPKADYETSKFNSIHCVNIPGSLITAGLSANKLGELVTAKQEKGYWGQRDQYEQVVLVDWHSEEKDVVLGSPLSNLHVSLTKWDPDCIYKNSPLILNGGFERFLDTYPTFTTNPKIKCPQKPLSSPFMHLSEHNIEYPMNVLEEDKPQVVKSKNTVSIATDSEQSTPSSRPMIDRTTKPYQSAEKMDKSDSALDIGKSVSDLEPLKIVNYDEIMEEEKEAPSQNNKLPSETSQLSDRKPLEKKPTHAPSNVPPRPVTPPRSDKLKVLNNKGKGDGEIYLEKTKFDTPSRGGLKRSASSPNINKLGDEDLDMWSIPAFDRSTKPKQNLDYIPRSAGADTVYQADSNKKGRGLTGLKNLGNLCYMNSIMQCISHTEELTRELTRFNVKECRNGRQIASEVSSLLRILWQGDTRITSCRHLKSRVGALRHSFSTMEQQDSHEFLTILVDWLHEDLNEPSNIRSLEGAAVLTGEKAWGEFRQKNNSVVLDLFYGQLKSTVMCEHCRTESVLFEPFSNLSIPLPSSPEDKDRTFTLQECLKLYLKGESISGWVCPNCKTARKATKKLDITRLPPVLIIHLKRFMTDMVGAGWCRKRMNMVDFPISDLDMKPFTHPESELRFHNYNLYAVSNHYGSMESGHYTAYCKNHMLNKWYKFDDQDVNEISPSEVKSSAAYILFFESCQFESQNQRIMD